MKSSRCLAPLLALLLAGCAAHPTAWSIELRPGVETAPQGWLHVLDVVQDQATCQLNGWDPEHTWGGKITVYPPPYFVGSCGNKVVGDNPGNHSIGIVWSRAARDGALPEEACHALLAICEKDFREEHAKACAVLVKGLIP